MPSTLKVTAFRQDAEEGMMLSAIAKERGISASRTIGQLVREEYRRLRSVGGGGGETPVAAAAIAHHGEHRLQEAG